MRNNLINQIVVFPSNDLFQSAVEGIVIANDNKTIAVKLLEAFELNNGKECTHLVAKLRYEDQSFESAKEGDCILCALTLVPHERFNSNDPCNVSWWRGGNAAIADVRFASSAS